VAGQIIPWNFPLLMAAWKIAPALACGNTVVLKPAETTPLTALLLAELIQEAELPDGVVNIITGAGATGAAVVNHPDVDKIAFTGSTNVGKLIQRATAGTGKKLTLELGGKAPNIIFADATIDQAVEGIVNGIWFNQGHVCCAGSRLYVEEGVHDEVVRKLKHRMKNLVVGDPLDKNTDIGAINSKEQLGTINKYLKIGINEGSDMYQSSCDLPTKGFWCRPTLFTNVAQSARIAQEEIFGPVLAIQTFRTMDEVIQKANNTPYGLSAGVWTDKGSKIFNLTTKLRAGVVWANTFNKFDPTSPFGGYKESGYGREGGVHGLGAYLRLNSESGAQYGSRLSHGSSCRSYSSGQQLSELSLLVHSVYLGVPALKCSAVGLSAASPRSFLAVGFPLLSLTRKAWLHTMMSISISSSTSYAPLVD
jgi:aldehyde dehydrogenase (NAD+)